MSSLNTIYIKKNTLETMLKVLEIKNQNGIELTISINDEANQFEQNVTAYASQSKEEREAKKERFYIGNGRTFWTDGKIFKIETEKKDVKVVDNLDSDDLPF